MIVWRLQAPSGMFMKFDASQGWIEDDDGQIFTSQLDVDVTQRIYETLKYCEIIGYRLEPLEHDYTSWMDIVNHLRDEYGVAYEDAREAVLQAYEELGGYYEYTSPEVLEKAEVILGYD